MQKNRKKSDKYEKNGIITPKKDKKEKFYTEYKKTKNEELELISLPNLYDTIRNNYSITTELYDTVPKYVFDDLEKLRTKEGFLSSLTRDFVFRKKKMSLKIRPALVETNGIEKAFYPSTREEIIEDVLRKFATDPDRNEFLDNRLSVKFSLYDLLKELKRIGHEYNYTQIKESLEILAFTSLEITSADGEISFASNMFETFGKVNFNDDDKINNEDYNKKVIFFVRFNSLISEDIKDKTWRVINYEQCMSYKKNISRWLHKRISNMFLVGDIKIPYHILLSTIIRDSGMTEYALISGNIRQIESCLEEMVKVGSIKKYKTEKIYDEHRTNKIIDAKFSLYISNSFYDDLRLNFLTKKDTQEIKQIQNKNLDNKKTKTKHNTKTEEDKTQDNLQKAKDYIKTIKNKKYKKISENLLRYFGLNVYIPWLSELKFVKIEKDTNTLVLSCTSEFVIYTIKKDYLNGVYRTEQDGSITWLRKGIKEIVEETEPEIKKIEIIKLSN